MVYRWRRKVDVVIDSFGFFSSSTRSFFFCFSSYLYWLSTPLAELKLLYHFPSQPLVPTEQEDNAGSGIRYTGTQHDFGKKKTFCLAWENNVLKLPRSMLPCLGSQVGRYSSEFDIVIGINDIHFLFICCELLRKLINV